MKTKFSFLGVQPPSNLFVISGQALQVFLYNICLVPANVRIITRILRPDGEMKEITSPVIAVNGVDPTILIIPLTECYILSCTVICDTVGIFPGHLFAVVNLINSVNVSAFVIEQLIAGYCSSRTSPTYPTTPLRLSTEVLPITIVSSTGDPAPGAVYLYTCPANLTVKVRSVRFTLTTAAGGGNRTACVYRRLGALLASTIFASATQAGGLSVEYLFESTCYTTLAGIPRRENFPDNFCLYQADDYRVGADGLVAADQISDVIVVQDEIIFV